MTHDTTRMHLVNDGADAHPPRPPRARTDQPSPSTRRRWADIERMSAAIDAARTDAHAVGVRAGYRQGWRWGLGCGLIAGALVAGLGWGAWLVLHVPDVAAPAAVGLL